MGRDEYRTDAEVDEYLWPLTGDTSCVHWESVAEELQIRQRLAEILAHTREMHVRPRLRSLGVRDGCSSARTVTASIIAGPADGPPWAQSLRHPVPRALRDEWDELAQRLLALHAPHQR